MHSSTFSYYRFSLEIEFKMRSRCRGHSKLCRKRHSNFLKHLEMALFFRCDNGIVNILFYPTSKIFPFVDSTFTLQQSFFWLIFRLGIRNGFNEKKSWFLSTIFEWCQCRWKTNLRNRTLSRSKKIELAFEIGLPVHEAQFSKTAITKNDTFFT